MPIRLSDLSRETRELAVELADGSVVNVTYRWKAITPAMTQMLVRFGELVEAGEQAKLTIGEQVGLDKDLIETLAWLLVDWDVTGDDDQALPVSAKVLMRLPSAFLYQLFGAIVGDNRPNDESVGSS